MQAQLTQTVTATQPAAASEDTPRCASLHKMMDQNPLAFVPPGTVDTTFMTTEVVMTHATATVD